MENRIKKSIYINLIVFPLYTLGPSIRVGVWFQGCSIRCDGCISKYTWQKEKKYKKNIDEVVKEINGFNTQSITISGGEPFDQPQALYNLLKKIRKDFKDILVYSGYSYEFLAKKYSYILELIDVLIDGEYKKDLPSNKAYKGSQNQRMFIFNEKLVSKYQKFFQSEKSEIQFYYQNQSLYLLGIPSEQIKKRIYNEI